MNLFVIAAVLIVYPMFGVGIYLIRNRLGKAQNFSYLVLLPVGLSFFIGVILLGYAIMMK